MRNSSVFFTPIVYGLAIGLLLNLLLVLLLTGKKAYTGDDRVSLLMFLIVCITCFFLLRNFIQKNHQSTPNLLHLGLLAIVFSLSLGFCLGIGHYIKVVYFDPHWAEKSLALLQEKWITNNYSEEAINSQIEHSEMYKNPISWGFIIAIFFSIISSIIGSIMSLIFYFKYRLQIH